MEWPKVSIVIVNWNGYEDTAECLESISAVTYPNYNVLVVDNNSRGNDVELLKTRFKGSIEVIESSENLGFAGGSNIGIQLALQDPETAYCLLLNNDTEVAPGFLEEMVGTAESDNNIGLVGAMVLEPSGRIQYAGQRISWCGGTIWQRQTELRGNMTVDTEFVPGSCMLIKRDVVDRIGLLSVEYFLECEDTDYCIRVSRAGFRIVCARTAKIWHKVSRSLYKVSATFVRYYIRNRIVVRAKYASLPRFLCFCINFMFFQALIYLVTYLVRWRRWEIVASFFAGAFEGFSIGLRHLRRRYSIYLQIFPG